MAQFFNTYEQKGIVFPLEVESGKVVISNYASLIEKSLLTLLNWPIHTLNFNPYFGTRINELIGEQNDKVLMALVKKFLVDAISIYERRVSILELTITMPTPSSMQVLLRYRIIATTLENQIEITQNI